MGTDYGVGDVARLSGVTVRTLHHYDEIGLLRPSARTAAGYRQYGYADLERLQRILAYRELGMPLEEIARVLDDPGSDPVEHLRRQHALLRERIERHQSQLAAIEKTLEAHRMGIELNPEEMFEVFGDDDPTQYAAEAEQRWGETDSFRESRRRASSYTKHDWLRMKADQAAVEHRLLDAMQSGLTPDSPTAMDAAEAHRQNISRWFYACPHAMHRGLGDMYVADPRFAAHYDEQAPGLAQFVRDAIHANADRAGSA
ncbi:MAG: MerR family transcriptional regulator [Frankia sp.]|nr:MerR family transcriptional regulator [Frankia sp.]